MNLYPSLVLPRWSMRIMVCSPFVPTCPAAFLRSWWRQKDLVTAPPQAVQSNPQKSKYTPKIPSVNQFPVIPCHYHFYVCFNVTQNWVVFSQSCESQIIRILSLVYPQTRCFPKFDFRWLTGYRMAGSQRSPQGPKSRLRGVDHLKGNHEGLCLDKTWSFFDKIWSQTASMLSAKTWVGCVANTGWLRIGAKLNPVLQGGFLRRSIVG